MRRVEETSVGGPILDRRTEEESDVRLYATERVETPVCQSKRESLFVDVSRKLT